MSDPAETVAQSVSEYLNDSERGFEFTVVATVPENATEDLQRETAGLRVLVVPVGISEEKETRRTVFVIPEINIIVTKPLENSSRAELSHLTWEIRKALRFVKQSGWTYRGAETLAKFDSDLIRKGQFLSAFQLTYEKIE